MKDDTKEPLGKLPIVFGVLAFLAVIPAIVERGGFDLSPGALHAVHLLNFAFLGAFILEHILAYRVALNRAVFLRENAVDLALLGALLAALALTGGGGVAAAVFPAKLYLFANLVLYVLRLFKSAARRRFHYARAFGLSFLAIIGVGALLLWLLPGAKADGMELSLVDAVFTATSATCVTGLVTVDTGSEFSRFGQTIIMVLFQVGGLGLMTFAAFFAITLGKGMGIRDREVMKGVLNLEVVGRIVRVIVGILVLTVVVEAASAAVLYSQWHGEMAPEDRVFHSLFHAVSAFCNAGFGLESDSLAGYVANPVVNGVVMFEIVLGGLGFAVVFELLGRAVRRLSPRRRAKAPQKPLSVQTKIVLVSTGALIILGTIFVYALEANNPATLGPLSTGESLQASLFQSITTRTAGFNTISIDGMTDASKFLCVVLMMIGASPGSTGGGVKTVTTVVLLLSVLSLYRGRGRVEIARRALPTRTVNRATVIVVTAIAIVALATMVLMIAEGGRVSFMAIFFEVGSAFGTVGLSTGITGSLGAVSKLTLCVVMLIGRIGPLSLVIALSQERAAPGFEYPEESVMIG